MLIAGLGAGVKVWEKTSPPRTRLFAKPPRLAEGGSSNLQLPPHDHGPRVPDETGDQAAERRPSEAASRSPEGEGRRGRSPRRRLAEGPVRGAAAPWSCRFGVSC